MISPPRPCSTPHCGNTTQDGGKCGPCLRKSESWRGGAHARGYDHEWQVYARAWLLRFPWCGQRADGLLHDEDSRCVRHAARTRATVVDHIVSLREGGARMDPGNHQSLCVGCNTAKDAPRGPRL